MPYTLSVYSEKLLSFVHICVVVRVIRVVVWVVSILCTLKDKGADAAAGGSGVVDRQLLDAGFPCTYSVKRSDQQLD